jgi:hypothetical protein
MPDRTLRTYDSPVTMDEVAVQEVILTNHLRGDGTPENPYRRVRQVFNKDGSFIAEWDCLVNPDIKINEQ